MSIESTTTEEAIATGTTGANSPATAGEALKVFFLHPSVFILSALTLGFSLLRIQAGHWSWADAVAPLAIFLFWPIMEWGIHVHLLHFKPFTLFGRKIDFLLPQTHREHHKTPWDIKRIFIPLHVYPLVAPILIGGAWLLAPTPELFYGGLAFYFLLALNYEFCHYLAHIRWCPPIEYYKRRVRLHRFHHFKHERLWWGVSMGLGDVLFGTAPDPEKVHRSGNTRDLLGRWPGGQAH